jgi:hypothetical protein
MARRISPLMWPLLALASPRVARNGEEPKSRCSWGPANHHGDGLVTVT